MDFFKSNFRGGITFRPSARGGGGRGKFYLSRAVFGLLVGPSFWSRLNTIKRIRIIMPSLIRYVISCLKFLITVQRTRLISPCARGVCAKKLSLRYLSFAFITVVTVSWISLRL